MLTAGEVLRQKRLDLKLTFTQVSEVTKIPLKLLKALEKSQFDDLPAYPFLKGVVQNYAKELNLDPAKIVAVFKRDYDRQRQKVMPVVLAQSLGQAPLTSWLAKPLTLFLGGVILLVALVGWSLLRVYQPPRLVVDSPQNDQTAISPVAIIGKTDRDAGLSLNGKIINLNTDGSFETTFAADPGTYELVFQSTSRRQRTTELTRKIIIID